MNAHPRPTLAELRIALERAEGQHARSKFIDDYFRMIKERDETWKRIVALRKQIREFEEDEK